MRPSACRWPRLKRPVIAALVFGSVCIVRPPPLAAQHEQHSAPQARGGSRFGLVAFANSGAPAAQPAFLRGLALLHNFQYLAASNAFREAQRIDPGFAMAYWGEAMTHNHGVWREQDSSAARAILARLEAAPSQRLGKASTEREKDYLRTLDVLYSTMGTKEARDTAYAAASERLANRYADDADAQLFHALALLSLFPRTDSTYARAGAIAERVMRDHPRHPGALHYVIHAYDDPVHASHGLAAARAYSKVAPDAPHAQHMTSHIFIARGMWDDVVAANVTALRGVESAAGPAAAANARCGHPGLWLHYAYLQQGRLANARRLMDGCRAGSAESKDKANGYAEMRLRYLLDVAQPESDVVAVPSPLPPAPEARFQVALASALHALRRGDTTGISPAMERLRAEHAAFDAGERAKAEPELSGAMGVSEAEVHALLSLRRGDTVEAISLLRAATLKEEALAFAFGPPSVEKPSHELLGEVLLGAGRPAEARNEFELALARTPGRALAVRGLARAGDVRSVARPRGHN